MSLELTFTKFKGDKGVWCVVKTHGDFIDTWKNEETKQFVEFDRMKLLNMVKLGRIKPV